MSDEDDGTSRGDYEVGYGKPPLHTRFQPGHKRSTGRRRGSKNTKTLMLEIWNENLPGRINGRSRRITRKEVSIRRLSKKAEDGDQKAFEKFEAVESEAAGESARAVQSQAKFTERADELTMEQILAHIRSIPPLDQPLSLNEQAAEISGNETDAARQGPETSIETNR
jgi:Family of unknown function (DUF5681)